MCATIEEGTVAMARSAPTAPLCSIAAPMELLSGRWKAPILYCLLSGGTQRFGAIRRFLPHITQRMLTLHLRELEADGVIHRRTYAQVPPRVEYALTEFGRSLEPILSSMLTWGRAHREQVMRLRQSESRSALVCASYESRSESDHAV